MFIRNTNSSFGSFHSGEISDSKNEKNPTVAKSDLSNKIDEVSRDTINSQSNAVPQLLLSTNYNNAHQKHEKFNAIYEEILKTHSNLNDQTIQTPDISKENVLIDRKGSFIVESSIKTLSCLLSWVKFIETIDLESDTDNEPSSQSNEIKELKIVPKQTPPQSNEIKESKTVVKKPLIPTEKKVSNIISLTVNTLPTFKKLFENSMNSDDLNSALNSLLNSIAKSFSKINSIIECPILNKTFIDNNKGADILIALLPAFIENYTAEELKALRSLIDSEESASYLTVESKKAFETMILSAEHRLSNM